MEFKTLLPSELDERQKSFGQGVFIYEKYAIIGSGLSPTNGNPQDGCAFIYKYDNGEWKQTCQLKPPPGDELDYIAWNVCMTNEYAIMSCINTLAIQNQFLGKAFIYKNRGDDVFELMTVLHPDDNVSSSRYGSSVAISGDIAVVGAPYDVIEGVGSVGSVYVYFREGNTWVQRHKLLGEDGSQNDMFGYSLSLSGKRLIVGDYAATIMGNVGRGAAYYFHFKGLGLTRKFRISAPNGAANDFFGYSVDIKEDKVIIGAPNKHINGRPNVGCAYTFSVSNDTLSYLGVLRAFDGITDDKFGEKVSIYKNYAIVGVRLKQTNGQSTNGKVYVYKRFIFWWMLIGTIVDPNPDEPYSLVHAISLNVFGGKRFIGIGNKQFNHLKGKVIIAQE